MYGIFLLFKERKPGNFSTRGPPQLCALSPDGLSVSESAKRLVERPMGSELSLEQCSKQLVALVAPHRRVSRS
jgi:hypothetical protein